MFTLSSFSTSRTIRCHLGMLAAVLASGCTRPDGEEQPSPLIPVGGVVTLNGKPLSGAVVTFLPQSGGSGIGDTDRDGRYTLKSMREPGVPAGPYKVAVSYMLSPQGEPQGTAARSSIVQSADMMAAKEQLPPEYSDLGRTALSAVVEAGKNTFNFDLKAPVALGGDGDRPASEQLTRAGDEGSGKTSNPTEPAKAKP